MKHPLLQLFIARLREFYREPEIIFWVYGFPLILTIGLGIAFKTREPEKSVVDILAGPGAAALLEPLEKAGMTVEAHDAEECRHRLRSGKTMMYLMPRSDGGYDYVFDKDRPESVLARNQVDTTLVRWRVGSAVNWKSEDEPVSEPGSRYIDFLLPGIIGMNLLGGGLWGVGFVIVDMRVRKLLKRLLATPMRRSHFLLSILTARMILMLPEMVLLLLLGWLAFGVPVRGSLITVCLFILVGATTFASLGLLIGSRTEKSETAQGLINLAALPMWLLSGIFFSSKRFPDAMQPLVQALPLTQFNDALREVMLEGASLADVAWRLGLLALWAVGTFVLAMKLFRWQ